jgi:type II secretory pathway component PulJ
MPIRVRVLKRNGSVERHGTVPLKYTEQFRWNTRNGSVEIHGTVPLKDTEWFRWKTRNGSVERHGTVPLKDMERFRWKTRNGSVERHGTVPLNTRNGAAEYTERCRWKHGTVVLTTERLWLFLTHFISLSGSTQQYNCISRKINQLKSKQLTYNGSA